MADESQSDRSTEDLSEEASQYRLQEYREKGRVAQSKEVAALFSFLGVAVCLLAVIPNIGAELAAYMREVLGTHIGARTHFGSFDFLESTFIKLLRVIGVAVLPFALVGFVLGALGSLVQIGAVFSFEPLRPDFSRIDPLKGFQRIFSMTHLWESIRIIVKGSALVGATWLIIKSDVLMSPIYMLQHPYSLLNGLSEKGKVLFFSLALILVVAAGVDFMLQKWEYSKSVRLTKKEQKEEHREHEGDPMIRARIRSIQREMSRRRMMASIKKADVIITNPTHIAIAVQYDREKMKAPKVVAKGADFVAQRIKQIAADVGVPIVENVPLARALFKHVKINHPIPKNLYQAVAEVLAYVYRLKNKRFF